MSHLNQRSATTRSAADQSRPSIVQRSRSRQRSLRCSPHTAVQHPQLSSHRPQPTGESNGRQRQAQTNHKPVTPGHCVQRALAAIGIELRTPKICYAEDLLDIANELGVQISLLIAGGLECMCIHPTFVNPSNALHLHCNDTLTHCYSAAYRPIEMTLKLGDLPEDETPLLHHEQWLCLIQARTHPASVALAGDSPNKKGRSGSRVAPEQQRVSATKSQRTNQLPRSDQATTQRSRNQPARSFTANNFGASAFSTEANSNNNLSTVYQELGLNVPCSTYHAAAQHVVDVIEGRVLHSKRLGQRSTSLVMSSNASKVMSVPASGTGGFTVGDTIVVTTPVHSSYKGIIIYSVAPAGTWHVLDYVSPDRDPEKISTSCGVLYSDLSISAPAAITGTSVAVTSQLMLEMAKVNISPVSLIAGKVAPLAEGRICPINVIGPEVHKIVNFTASDPETVVRRFSSNDPLNPSIVRVPNASFQGTDSAGSPSPFNAFRLDIAPSTADNCRTLGFSAAYSSAFPNALNVSTAGATIWNLSECCDYNRHILFGDFEVMLSVRDNSLGDAHNSTYAFIVTYAEAGGATTEISRSLISARVLNDSKTSTFFFNTRGYSQFAAKRGLVVKDMRIFADPMSNTTDLYTADLSLAITFIDVPARETYLAAVISGVQSGYRVAATVNAHTEVLLDPSSLNATYLTATDDLPYDPTWLPLVIRTHALTSGHEQGTFAAKSFKDTMRKILKFGGKVGRLLTPLLPTNAQPLANAATDYLQERLGATSFGEGSAPTRHYKKFFFPAVQLANSVWGVVPVVREGVHGDEELNHQLPCRCASPIEVEGRSHTLALLLCALDNLGFPVKAGCYSGEVRNVQFDPNEPNEVTFDLLPVDCPDEKISAARQSGDTLLGLFADGWYAGYSYRPFKPSLMFGARCNVTCDRSVPPPGYPGESFTIRVQW